MTRTNLLDTARNLHVGDEVQDGRTTATVRQTDRIEIQLEYDNGDTIWMQDNRFQWDDAERCWRIV